VSEIQLGGSGNQTLHGHETVFTNGRIITMTTAGDVDTLVIGEDRVLATGDRTLAEAHPTARVVDLTGRTVVPGFIDAHNHLSLAALEPLWIDLDGVIGLSELMERIADGATRDPSPAWIRGCNWIGESHLPFTRQNLDALGLDRPIAIAARNGHRGVLCSRALDALHIGPHSADPPYGTIHRDERGQPTGLLAERAWSIAHAVSMGAYNDPERWPSLIKSAANRLVAEGITAIHDAACSPAAEAAYRSLVAANELPLSVLAMPHPEALLTAPHQEIWDRPPTGEGDEWFRIGPVKLFADGSLMDMAIDGHFSGWFHVHSGSVAPDLVASATTAAHHGFTVSIHAFGNAAMRASLDAVDEAALHYRGTAPLRFRVEHAAFASTDQMVRMANSGVVGVLQPSLVHYLQPMIETLPFSDIVCLPFRELLDAGVPLAGSSDSPCLPTDPILLSTMGMGGPPETPGTGSADRISFHDWLRLYTVGSAYAGCQEGERGSLKPGLRADLAILDGPLDPYRPPRVSETWVAGRLAYSRDTAAEPL
jgi:predicted amidohydrolase YtcJ